MYVCPSVCLSYVCMYVHSCVGICRCVQADFPSKDLYERIAGRIDERSFPYVLAAEAQEETVKHIADSMLSSMMKSDYVEIQSYLDHKWSEFRSSSPALFGSQMGDFPGEGADP